VLDFAPQLIAVLGPNRERVYANRGALDYLNVGLDEWRQRDVSFPSTPGISRAMPVDYLLDQFLAKSLRQWARAQ
jgi:hypothetical protein